MSSSTNNNDAVNNKFHGNLAFTDEKENSSTSNVETDTVTDKTHMTVDVSNEESVGTLDVPRHINNSDFNHLLEKVRKDANAKIFVKTKKDSIIGQDNEGKIFVRVKKKSTIETLYRDDDMSIVHQETPISSTSTPPKPDKAADNKTTVSPSNEDVEKRDDICTYCETIKSRCDNILYGKYCLKAVYNHHRQRGCARPLCRGEIKGVF